MPTVVAKLPWPGRAFSTLTWRRGFRAPPCGFLFLISRKTAVINLAGRKVFPEEIEAVINRHPGVRESRVYGRPHPQLGEVVEAELVLEPPEVSLDPIRQYCREHLASYKIPMRFHIVPALPRTPVTGKIRRAAPVA